MRILQLGNGGGFDFDKTNSSFLIEQDEHLILFDCGFNIMSRLKSYDSINIEDIDVVYISHMDEDHIGNLKMFIYYRYFMFNKKTNIICHLAINDDINNYLKKVESELIGCKVTNAYMYDIMNIGDDEIQIYPGISIQSTPCNHGSTVTHGAIFRAESKSVFISADTKASKYIEEISKDCDLIFHDYSHWDFVTRNVHACKTDFELEYSEEYRERAIKYHTGDENFKKDWYEL